MAWLSKISFHCPNYKSQKIYFPTVKIRTSCDFPRNSNNFFIQRVWNKGQLPGMAGNRKSDNEYKDLDGPGSPSLTTNVCHFSYQSTILIHREEKGALAVLPNAIINNITSIAVLPKFLIRTGNTRVNIAYYFFLLVF